MANVETLEPGLQLIIPDSGVSDSVCGLSFNATGDTVGSETRFSLAGNITDNSLRLAEEFDMPFVIANRPGTGRGIANDYRRTQTDSYNYEAARHAKSVNRALDREGIRGVIIHGDSIAATYALAITRSEELPVQKVGAYDAVGWLNTSRHSVLHYLKYALFEERQIRSRETKSLEHNIDNQPSIYKKIVGKAQMVGRQILDLYGSIPVCTTDQTLKNVRYIRDNLANIAVLLQFPENSFTLPIEPDDRDEIFGSMIGDVDSARPAEFRVEELADTCHGSINSPKARARFVRDVLNLKTDRLRPASIHQPPFIYSGVMATE